MVAYEIVDKKSFTSELFDGKLFDDFLSVSAEIVTYNTFNIDGKIKKRTIVMKKEPNLL